MKTNIIILIFGIVLGFFLSQKISKPVIQTEIKEDIKTKIVKIKEPNGKIIETKIIEKKRDETPRQTLSRYAISAGGLKSLDFVQIDARLGDLPLFTGVQAKKDSVNIILRYEF